MALVIFDGDQQSIEVPFDGRVVGTAAAETVQVTDGADVEFGAGAGDRVEFEQSIDAYEFSNGGNTLTVENPDGSTAEISLNADTELAFADGSTTAGLDTSDGITAKIGGQAVGSAFDAAAVSLDGSDPSGVADTSGGNDDPGTSDPVNAPELEVRFENPEAFGDTTDDFREATHTAWDAWMQHMDPHPDAGPVVVELDFSADSALVAESSSTGTALTNEFIDGERLALDTVLADVADGVKENAAGEVDAEIGIRTNPQEWDFGPGAEAGNIDAESVLKHEFGRVFGMGPPFGDGFTGRFHANLEPFEQFNPDVGDPIPMNPSNPNTLADGEGVMSDLVNRDTVSEEITEVDLRVMDTIGMPVKDSSLGIDDGAVA